MNKTIQIFENAEFGAIRTLTGKDGEPWFVGKDVATALGYSNSSDAILKHVDNEDRLESRIAISGQKRKVIFINESGLYSLILSSKLPSAKRFKRWVTSEVLPQIRKTGGYIPTYDEEGRAMSDEEIMAHALQISQRTIEQQRPKALFHDCVAESEDTCSVAEMAKMIEANGYPMGQKRLFEWLRNNGYLCTRNGQFFNTPYQMWVERGLFRIETGVSHAPDGTEYVYHTTRITGKGQAHLLGKFFEVRSKN
ncbi:MAG: phage antirepressor [Bacteroidales bacterium]|nr:phage antirepressor [Bacteroidales bacterium]